MPEIVFKGKEYVYNHHLTVPYRPLVVQPGKGVGDTDLAGNLVIHGDNLQALKSLLPRHAGQVDLVFIDPPYNTGNEGWCYSDNVNSPIMKEWLSTNPVDGDDLLRHDKWLCMMWPRLVLLRELLSERGSIWITLDDNEVHRARMVLDEVFGEDRFVANVVWQHSAQGKGYTNTFSVHHNHLLVYAGSDFSFEGLDRTDADNVNYSNPDGDPRGLWRSGDVKNSLFRPNLRYSLETPSGKTIAPPENGWRWSRETMASKIATGEVVFLDGETRILRKIYLDNQSKRAPETLWFADAVGSSRDGTNLLKELFGGESPFATPKPVELIERVIELAADKGALILDSFAGSGTTAHAVLKANAKDGGNRRFILIEGEAYADTLTAERVRRVVHGYAWSGTRHETLLEEKISFTQFKKSADWLARIAQIKAREGFADSDGGQADLVTDAAPRRKRFDKIDVKLDDGVLRVEGVQRVSERAEGLGGSFTYCTLGDPLSVEQLLSGERLPPWAALGDWLFHTATGGVVPPRPADAPPFYLGEAADRHVWLIYQPELAFLKSPESALTLTRAGELQAWGRDFDAVRQRAPLRHLVFAPAKYLGNKQLQGFGIDFAPLPFALYREG